MRPSTTRAKVSNGSKLLAGVDGRSSAARRFRDLTADLAHEFSVDLSTAELGLVRQAAALTLRAELLQAAIVRGEPVNADELIRLSSEARRILASLRKRPKAVQRTSLAEHITQHYPAPAHEVEDETR